VKAQSLGSPRPTRDIFAVAVHSFADMGPGRDHDCHVRLLGQFRLTVDGRPAAGPMTARLHSLLAYLLLHADAPQSRAHLSFTFWPDASEPNARNNLRQLLHQLRQALPDPDRYLRADTSSVQWVPDSSFSLDVALFDSAVADAEGAGRAGDAVRSRACLERAVALCQGSNSTEPIDGVG
jgi:DNA-binding SARP family transcriptional activator